MKRAAIFLSLFAFTFSAAHAEKGSGWMKWLNKNDSKKHHKKKGHHDEEYKKPVEVKSIGFTATLADGTVKMAWKKYKRADFAYYKVMKSAEHSNPVYPDQPAIHYADDPAESFFVDDELEPGTWHYRVCVITKAGNRWVSPVVRLTVDDEGMFGEDRTSESPPSEDDFE